MDGDVTTVRANSSKCPTRLRSAMEAIAATRTVVRGSLDALDARLLGLFCSARCPGELIIRTYDLARALRDAGIAVAGGFHSPMEKECVDLLLRGTQPVVLCPARQI